MIVRVLPLLKPSYTGLSINMINIKQSRGFTLIELLMVITIIGILASIGVVSYGNYQKSIKVAQLKSDLNGAATVMENERTFNNLYPVSLPSTFTPTKDANDNPVTILSVITSADRTSYCIDITSYTDSSLHYHIDSSSSSKGAQDGLCASSSTPIPGNLVAKIANNTSLTLSWDKVAGATSYILQRAEIADTSFSNPTSSPPILQPAQSTVTYTSTVTQGSTYHYRVNATKLGIASVFSNSIDANTTIPAPSVSPIVAVTLSGSNILATVTNTSSITCSTTGSVVQYRFNSHLNDSATWTGYNDADWNIIPTTAQSALQGVKYGYKAQARCYVDSSTYGSSYEGSEGTYTNYKPWTSQISVSYNDTCAITSDSQVYCWGWNAFGELGNNLTANSPIPVAVSTAGVLSGKTVLSLSTGNNHSCVIASNNLAYCWGANWYGNLGTGSGSDSFIPIAVSTSGVLNGLTIKLIDAGNYHTCAIASNNLAYCWGSNDYGELGNNSTTQSNIPVAVNGGLTMSKITAGEGHTCAITVSNLAYCWGRNIYGQLGNNSTTQSNIPVAVNTTGVLSGKTIKSIKASKEHSCVIASDNLAYCWGSNWFGELGVSTNVGTINPNSVPVAVDRTGVLSGKTILSIATGVFHTCVIASDNKIYCWGDNTYGQLGNNSTTQSSAPVAVSTAGVLSGKTIVSISTSDGIHTCATDSDSKLYCWGSNVYGELGNNSTTQSNIPIITQYAPN